MSMEYISIYLCLLKLRSLMSYNFKWRSLLPHWLNMFLGILFFLMQRKKTSIY